MEKLGEVGLARVATWLQGEEGARSAGAPFANSQPSLLLQPARCPCLQQFQVFSYSKPLQGSTSKLASFLPFLLIGFCPLQTCSFQLSLIC